MPQTGDYTFTQTVSEINEFIVRWGGNYWEFYVGITSNPLERLFRDHNVNNTDAWIYRDAGSSDAARLVESYFLKLGCRGGGGGGDLTTRFVYTYKIKSHTIE